MSNRDKQVCMYCFNDFYLEDASFVCCDKRINGSRNKDSALCPSCGRTTITRLCPNCNSELPYTIGHVNNLIFSIIGAKDAGKSHYIAVLIDKIMNEISPAFDCSLKPLNDETIRRYREDFYNPIFRRNETLNVTLSGKTNDEVKKPLLYSLTFYGKDIFNRKKTKSIVTLAFFDTAGEDLDSEDTMNIVNRYICNSAGIIFLVDPLQMDGVRDKIEGIGSLPEQYTDNNDIISRAATLIRKTNQIPVGMIDIPIAVTLSKIDALDCIFEGQSVLSIESDHISNKKLNLKDFKMVNNEVEGLIKRHGGNGFLSQLQSFKDNSLFGISALGCNPHGTQKINRFRPRRVEDPFLWLLMKNKIIK